MYKSYFQKDGKTYALDKTGKFNIVKTTDNVEEILILKNNIEEIENILKETKKNQIINKDSFNTSNILTIGIDLISIVMTLIPAALPLKIMGIIIFIISSAVMIKDTKEYLIKKKEYSSKTEILEKMLTLEKEKLNVLEKNAKEIEITKNIKEKNIDTSEKIKNLYKKLELIIFYSQNSFKMHYLYINYGEECLRNNLEEKYSKEDVDFIIFLLNKVQDKRKNNIENNKVKKMK